MSFFLRYLHYMRVAKDSRETVDKNVFISTGSVDGQASATSGG